MNKLQNLWHHENFRLLAWASGLVVVWRLCLELINQAIVPYIQPPIYSNPGQPPFPSPHFYDGLMRWVTWDGGWYSTIVQKGYIILHHMHGYETIAFFPMFPATVRILHDITRIPYQYVGLGLNVILTVAIVFALIKLTQLLAAGTGVKDGIRLGKIAAVVLLLNPASFFLIAFYADAILVLSVLLAVYFGLRRWYWLAAIAAAVATATKSIGVALLPVLFVMYLQDHGAELKDLPKFIRRYLLKLVGMMVVSALGIITYMAYLWHRFGDPLAFLRIEKYWSRTGSGSPLGRIWHDAYARIGDVGFFGDHINYMYRLYLMAIPIIIAGFVVYMLIRHRLRYAWLAVLCVLTVAIPMSTGILDSLNRYVLVMAPLISYILVHIYAKLRFGRVALQGFLFLSATMLFITVTAFLTGFFVG